MAKGRKAKPYKLKLLEGNRGKRKLSQPPEPKKSLGPPPSNLDKVAKELWNKIAEWYGDIDIVKDADSKQIEIFCRAYSEYKKYTAEIKRHGAWYTMPTGSIRLHPRVMMRDRALVVIHRFGSALGFGPVERQKLAGLGEGTDSELEKLFKNIGERK